VHTHTLTDVYLLSICSNLVRTLTLLLAGCNCYCVEVSTPDRATNQSVVWNDWNGCNGRRGQQLGLRI